MKQQDQQGTPIAAEDDKLFIANFIVANCLGPDVYADEPPNISAAQRLSQRFPPYTTNHLGQSSLTVTQIQSLYYYILRNSINPSLIFDPTQFHFYLKGKLISPYPSAADFTSFFPLHIHNQKLSSTTDQHGVVVIKGLVVIHDPAAGWVNREELDRFILLTGLVDLKVDRDSWLSYNRTIHENQRPNLGLVDETNEITTMTTVIVHGKPVTFELFGLSWDQLVVIGIGSTSYLFRVAIPPLPDNSRGLSCEVSWDGEVEINHSGGLTFTTSFNLPGHVDPRLFSPNLKRDRIFEAVIVKTQRQIRNSSM